MDNLKSLGKGLPATAVDTSLALEFRNAANAVTKLYKVSNEKAQVARHEGYKQCLSDVLGFLQQHQQRHVDGLRRESESEGESGDLAHELWKWVTKQEERLDEDDTNTITNTTTTATATATANTNTGGNANTSPNATSSTTAPNPTAATNTNINTTSSQAPHDTDVFRMGFTPFSFSQDLVYPGYAAVKRKGHAHGHVYHCDEDSDEDEGSKRMRLV
ncbi:hypothetical protein B0I72DRAFT_22545 [Yarrowia lipolytica]|jgi:hypothetical protein|uniref:Uncharacterized protein n=1 Tax=Yarrowia lipolytica TaxID=4952 RepID=A0A371CC77_YARLL|nr:Hypothetical protein YALI2_F00239g [Yarrowia lipolytica]RDW27896.1 hypothetical protein B0I71DRAFT_13146 [Yarrowia lipolytica]RDW33984.1 hypothetical protein B0I72DRAFT_22545 [Yarrowia lipolytica]RDW41240.1 hypothetical protein B0I73DRAFT_10642 [Yarrowia lipolytica]RDW46936.1 hypothetical protein B0I74DRAFT_22523 [Yarrowia lipolytica]